MYRNYKEVEAAVRASSKMRAMAVAGAADAPVIEAVLRAYDEGIAKPILVGDAAKIRELIAEAGRRSTDFDIVDAAEGREAQRAVDLVRDGSADILMKGLLETRDMLRPVVAKENDLRTGKLMSHVVFFSGVNNYHKLLVSTDGGMVMYPTLEDKAGIIENAVIALRAMGYAMPKVAVLAAIEKVNPKMRESVEAAELKAMNLRGEISDCLIEGPISYDVAMDAHIAAHKGFDCPYCGDFDVLIVPDMNAGNILGKCLIVTGGAEMAGIIVGARVPIVMTSRGSSADEKFYSITVAALTAMGSGR